MPENAGIKKASKFNSNLLILLALNVVTPRGIEPLFSA